MIRLNRNCSQTIRVAVPATSLRPNRSLIRVVTGELTDPRSMATSAKQIREASLSRSQQGVCRRTEKFMAVRIATGAIGQMLPTGRRGGASQPIGRWNSTPVPAPTVSAQQGKGVGKRGFLDADKKGFLRSGRSLIQTIGRAARNLNGKAIFYADRIAGSMERAWPRPRIGESDSSNTMLRMASPRRASRRRWPISWRVRWCRARAANVDSSAGPTPRGRRPGPSPQSRPCRESLNLMHQARAHARALEFEEGARTRDQICRLKEHGRGLVDPLPA